MKSVLFRTLMLLGSLLLPLTGLAAGQASPPNFVVIIADDLGADDVGAFGHPVVKTPNIDRLAQHGIRFDNAFLTTSSCTASRASILTGMYPHSSGAPKLNDGIPGDRKLASSYLRDAGYYTAAIGKWHVGEQVVDQFDLVFDPPGDSGAEGWVEALRNRPQDKPFFFWFASRDPHVPYSELQKEDPYQPKDAVILPTMLDSPGARLNIAQYYTEISRLDDYVGKVMQELQAEGALDNTYVIFLSDNGASMPHAKTTLYDTGIKTPLIMRGPGVTAGKKTGALVSGVDLMPTVLALAGVPTAETMEGRSFNAILANPQGGHRTEIYAEQHDHGFHINKRAVRSRDYLYIRNIGENKVKCLLEVQPMGRELQQAFRDGKLTFEQSLCFGRKLPEEELYDVRKDRHQVNNLAADPAYADIRQQMRSLLDAQAKATNDTTY